MKPELHDYHVVQMNALIEHCRGWGVDHNWWGYVYEDAKAVGALMGIRVDDFSFSLHCQGAGVSMTGRYYHPSAGVASKVLSTIRRVQAYAPQDAELLRIARALYHAQRVNFYGAACDFRQHCRYNVTKYEWSHAWDKGFNRRCITQEDDMEQALNDFANWVYKRLNEEYDWLTSDECVLDIIRANERGLDLLETP